MYYIETNDKKDEDPMYKSEKLCKSISKDIHLGMYINKNNRLYKPLPMDFEEVRGHIEIPRNLCQGNAPPDVMIRSIWTSFDDFTKENHTALIPVGGVVIFDIYKFTELFPVNMKGWVVRQIFDKEKSLTSISYPDQKCMVVY